MRAGELNHANPTGNPSGRINLTQVFSMENNLKSSCRPATRCCIPLPCRKAASVSHLGGEDIVRLDQETQRHHRSLCAREDHRGHPQGRRGHGRVRGGDRPPPDGARAEPRAAGAAGRGALGRAGPGHRRGGARLLAAQAHRQGLHHLPRPARPDPRDRLEGGRRPHRPLPRARGLAGQRELQHGLLAPGPEQLRGLRGEQGLLAEQDLPARGPPGAHRRRLPHPRPRHPLRLLRGVGPGGPAAAGLQGRGGQGGEQARASTCAARSGRSSTSSTPCRARRPAPRPSRTSTRCSRPSSGSTASTPTG